METKDILKSDVLDIIFEGRNKTYGAYELRKNYEKRLRNAIIGCVAIAGVLVAVPVIGGLLKDVKPKKINKPKIMRPTENP